MLCSEARVAYVQRREAAEMGAKAIARCGVATSDKSLASLSWRALRWYRAGWRPRRARRRGARAGRAARSQATWQTKSGEAVGVWRLGGEACVGNRIERSVKAVRGARYTFGSPEKLEVLRYKI